MTHPTKLIEFVFTNNNFYYLGVFDIADISSITELDEEHCTLTKKDSSTYKICGNLRTTTNRWIYTIEKRIKIYDDYIIRPSVAIIHSPLDLGVDGIYFDLYQLKNFILCVKPEVLTKYPNILTD